MDATTVITTAAKILGGWLALNVAVLGLWCGLMFVGQRYGRRP